MKNAAANAPIIFEEIVVVVVNIIMKGIFWVDKRCHLIMRQHVHGYTSLSFKLPQATVNPEDLSFPSRTGRDGCPEGKKIT